MTLTKHIAKQLRDTFFGDNWTSSNVKDNVANLTWHQATTQVYHFNNIATLIFHSTYYVKVLLEVLQTGILDAKDEYSFQLPPITSQKDWEDLVENAWIHVEDLAKLIEELPESKLTESFANEKYGNYYRNITGVIEHMHYHLGQIVLIKKIITET
jgi:hypothetical protein